MLNSKSVLASGFARRQQVIKAASLIVVWSMLAYGVSWTPENPTAHDTVTITIPDFTPGDVLHWGVYYDGIAWARPMTIYRPTGSTLYGNAVRTTFDAVNGQGQVTLGPFNDPLQKVDGLVFAISYADGTWDNNRGDDYSIRFSSGRITVEPGQPTANDRILVTVHNSDTNGLLRWGVNAERNQWEPTHPVYWPRGSIAADDGIGLDSPLSPPDSEGRSTIALGPFNRPEQVVKSLHLAVHWDGEWDTDGGRNYNIPVQWRDPNHPNALHLRSPADGASITESLRVLIATRFDGPVQLWWNDEPVHRWDAPPYIVELPLQDKPYGPGRLTAQAVTADWANRDALTLWHVPAVEREDLPTDVGFGATELEDGTVTFALYAPGKRFVSLVGDFNDWDDSAHRMRLSPDGTWWINLPLDPGVYEYQYVVEGHLIIADPYAREVNWTTETGKKGWLPEDARTILRVGAERFNWTATNYQRPSLEELVIYEVYIEDFVPGKGFQGLIDKLDYIEDLGFNAIEPLPWHPWPGDESWGYNPAFHFGVEQLYGSAEDLKRLIDAAHQRGMAVIIDMVLNHAAWVSPIYQLYAGDYEASPYFREYHGDNWGFPKIDQESPAVKRYVADVIRFWIEEYRIDGFRYDATRWTGWHGFNDWGASWFAYVARNADPDNIQIAEHLPIEVPLITDTEMDTTWHAEYRWRIREMIQGAYLDPHALDESLDARRVGFEHNFQRIPYTESHDEERVVRELREAGFDEDEVLRRTALALIIPLTTPGIPMIYAGQEFGEATVKFVGWNPLNWDLLDQPMGRQLHDVTRRLVRLRTQHPALRVDNLRILAADPQTGLVIYERMSAPHGVMVAVNLGRRAVNAKVELSGPSQWQDVLNGQEVEEPVYTFTLAPGEGRVWATLPHDDE